VQAGFSLSLIEVGLQLSPNAWTISILKATGFGVALFELASQPAVLDTL
jgi:hypothetical protein